MKRTLSRLPAMMLCVACLTAPRALAATTNVLAWDREQDRVSADVRDWELIGLLERIAVVTGWHVFVEPDSSFKASVKFGNVPSREALRLLLRDMNYAIVPQTNSADRLYVFRTTMQNATQAVRAAAATREGKARRVPNELIIRVKPGTDIEALARSLGAKVVGSIPELDAYRLQFEDEEAAERARRQLAENSEVLSVQDNYYVDAPPAPQTLGMAAPQTKLTLDPPKGDNCKVIVGIVDTALPALGGQLEPFIKERLSVVGETAVDNNVPTHATAIANALFQSVESFNSGHFGGQILPVDVFGPNQMANTFNVAAGIALAVNRGATVINTSLGANLDDPLMRDMVRQVTQRGIPVFAAVGNDANPTPFFPAAYPEVISVTALARPGRIASYANTGTQPDLAAPGVVVFSHNGLTYASQGTSVSSAAAAGIAAALVDSSCASWAQVLPVLQRRLAVPSP